MADVIDVPTSDECCDCNTGSAPLQPEVDPKEGIIVRSKQGILVGNIINKYNESGKIVYELDDFTLTKPILAFTNNAPVTEVGDTVSSVLFSGNISQGSYPIASRSLTPSESVDLTAPFTFSKANVKLSAPGLGQQHTLQAQDDHGNASTVINGVIFRYAVYQGFNSLAVLDQTAIKALANKKLLDSILDFYGGTKTYVVPGSPPGPKYLYWAGPIGTPVVQGAIMNGLPLPLVDPGNVNVTNIHDGAIITQYWVRRTAVRFDAGSYDITIGTSTSSGGGSGSGGSGGGSSSASAGTWRNCGFYDASVNVFPASGGTGPGGSIQKDNTFDISVSGTLGGQLVPAGATIRAVIDSPGQTLANWRIYF